jgi:hypothetical protein
LIEKCIIKKLNLEGLSALKNDLSQKINLIEENLKKEEKKKKKKKNKSDNINESS